MKVLIYGINFSPELIGIGKYSGEMAYWMANKGHDIRVITSPPYYPSWSIKKDFKNSYSYEKSRNISIIRCPLYVPSKPNTLKRFAHLASFSLSSSIPLLASIFWKPDVVIQVVPTIFCSIQTLIITKLTGSKSVIHIQDFEVDAMFGLSKAESGLVKKISYLLEKKILDSFKIISTISQGMIDRALKKGIDRKKLIFFPNWVDLDHFKNQQKDNKFLIDLGVSAKKKIVLYSGNIGEKQGLELILYAAKYLEDNSNIQFVIVGEGAIKERLIQLSNELNLANIFFFPILPYNKLPGLLASADCHLVIQKKGVADAVLPSKLSSILAVGGNAVITASRDTTLGILCSEYSDIAVRVEPESVEDLVTGIERALLMPKPNRVAKKYSKDFLDKDMILNRFLKDIE